MSPSGAEVIRQIRSSVEEVDPSEVNRIVSNGNGIVLLDVRESDEWDAGHIPGAKHVARGYLESRVEGIVGSDRSQRVIIYCASGQRSALAANTLKELLGYEDVASMNGGITLWKDRGYDVEVPLSLSKEQRERYSRHLLVPEIGLEGQEKLLNAKVLLLGAGGLGSPPPPCPPPARGAARRPGWPRPARASARSASATTTTSISRTCSVR